MDKSINTPVKNYCAEAIKYKKVLESSFLVLAKMLWRIREEQLWEEEGYTNMEEFSAELKMSSASISKLISVYEVYVRQYKIPEQKLIESGGWSSLYSCIKYATTKEKALELVERSALMTREHLVSSLKISETKEHKHEWQEVHFRQCSICGERQKIYE